MPRSGRVVIADCPHHIVQRGHNRASVFADSSDYRYYLESLKTWKRTFGVKVYAYCLMTNHVHLVLDPGEESENLGRLMKRLAGRQTRRANVLERRTGSLWEGRYKSSPIETDSYLLACCRYVELNPVRASMVAAPEDYRWSSYRAKVGMRCDEILDFDPCYLGLAEHRKERWRRYVNETIPQGEWELIRQAVRRNQLTGTDQFTEEVAHRTGKRIDRRGPGRPRREARPSESAD
jgi:putative transposase